MTLNELIEQKRKEKVKQELNTIVQKKLQAKQESKANLPTSASLRRKAYNASESTKPITNNTVNLPQRKEYTTSDSANAVSKVNLPVAQEFKQQLETGKRVQVPEKYSLPTFVDNVKKNSVSGKAKQVANDVSNVVGNIGYGLGNGLIDFNSRLDRAAQAEAELYKNDFEKIIKMGESADLLDEIEKIAMRNNQDSTHIYSLFKTYKDAQNGGNKITNKLNEQKQINNQKIQENINDTNGVVAKKISELTPSIGQMLPSMLPYAGIVYAIGSSQQAYYEDAKQKGMSEEEAERYGNIMGSLEGATDFVGGKLTKAVGKNIAKGGLKQAGKSFALDVAENVAEEAVMEPLSELTATAVAGKEYANWDNIGKRMLQAGIDGGLVGMIMGGASAGIGSAVNVANKISKGQTVTQNEINIAKQDVNNRITDKQVQQKLQEAQEIINKVQNEPVNTQTQQTTNKGNKVAQNGNMEQIKGVENDKQTLYNDVTIGKTRNVPIDEVLKIQNRMGYRTEEEINSIKEYVRQNGLQNNPIELVKRNDGTIEIEDGNHRLLIAKELGMKEIPIKFVESWENIGRNIDTSESNLLEYMEVHNDTNNRNSERISRLNEQSGNIEESSISNRNEFENRGTTEGNDNVFNSKSQGNGYSSDNEIRRNIKESEQIKNSSQGSFNLPIQNITAETQSINNPNNVPYSKEVVQSIKEKSSKTLNPTQIANLSKEKASTTPNLPPRNYARGNKESSFLSNITTDAGFLNEDLRHEMAKEDNIRYYKGITNAETLEKAYTELQNGGEQETVKWFNKDNKNTKAEDVAKGWILLKQYQDKGDYQGAVEVAKKMRDMATNAGQTVQAYNILSRLTPEGMFYYAQSELTEAYNKMVQGKSKAWIEENSSKFDLTAEETQTIKEKMESIQGIEDERTKKVVLAEIQKIITDKIPTTTSQSVKAWMRISMLFNPKTQVRNVMGNAVILPVNMTSDFFSSGIDRMIAKKTGIRTTGNTNIKSYAKGFGKGVYESYDDFRRGINTRNVEGNRFEVSEGKNFKDKGIGKALNKVDNILSFALDVGDRAFYEGVFTNSINNQLVLNNTTEVTQDMIDIATNEALQRTWQDNNAYTNSVLKIRKILNFGKGYGLGDVLIPFAKTPANLTKAIVDYSPVGLAKTLAVDARKFKNSLENGQYTPQLQHQFVQNIGKGMAGSFLYVLGYALAKAGVATGEADDDKDVKNFMKNSLGISSYSIKIGDKTFTYDWAQPVATPLAIMTNYVKYSKDNPNANAIEKAWKSMNIGTEQLLQQSFMESLNTVLNGSGTTLENLSQAVLELPARAIPTFSKQIADMVDGTQRTSFEYGKPIESAVNSVKAKVPFVSRSLPVAVDTLGNEIQKYGGNNNVWNVMFNPANTNKGQLSKAGEEIYNVYMQTGDTTIFPRTAPYYINSKGEKINMDATQRSEFQKVTGTYVENALNGLLDNKDYKKLSNEKKAEVINEIVSDSYAKAKYDILKIDSEQYEKLRNTLKNVSTTSYYNYKFKTEDMKKDKEKIGVLVNSNYANKEKQVLYESYIKSKNDTEYPVIKTAGININEYLKYKQQEFSSDKKDDGTLTGKTVSKSKQKKVTEYLNSMNITGNQRLLLYSMQGYSTTSSQKKQLANYVQGLSMSKQEKLKLFDKFSGFTVYKNGKVTW